jgi:hypothetical protein
VNFVVAPPRRTSSASRASRTTGVLQRKCACGGSEGECEGCRKQHEGGLQRSTLGTVPAEDVPPIVHEVLREPGNPLAPDTRAFMESRFARDFSRVRAHTDSRAARSAAALNARAFTVNQHIVFGAGEHPGRTESGNRLLAHELTHAIQQEGSSAMGLTVVNSPPHEREAQATATAALSRSTLPTLSRLSSRSVARREAPPTAPSHAGDKAKSEDQPSKKAEAAPPTKGEEKCEEFPGGSTDCVIDEATGIPTGRVTHQVDETNPCTKPCVEEHEAVHLKQMKTFCPELRDCYRAADKGKRDVRECITMAMFAGPKRECAAYQVSVPCMEKRLRSAKECQSKENREYGTRKLASEKCFRTKNCSLVTSPAKGGAHK